MTIFPFSDQTVLNPNLGRYFHIFTLTQLSQEVKALLKRFILQSCRRSSFVISGIIQPLLWLILFGALFQQFVVPGINTTAIGYIQFLSSGIIVFTAFTSSLNAGLPIMFDREFGFFNRLLVAPMTSRFSIVIASFTYIVIITILQLILISFITFINGPVFCNLSLLGFFSLLILLFLLICLVTIFSIVISFILPGHIELLALILLINLPILFSSTALAPLVFMPRWLQIIASLNPLTYSIEAVRYVTQTEYLSLFNKVIISGFGSISLLDIIYYFILSNFILFVASNRFFHGKLE